MMHILVVCVLMGMVLFLVVSSVCCGLYLWREFRRLGRVSDQLKVQDTIALEALERLDVYKDFIQRHLLETGLSEEKVFELLVRLDEIPLDNSSSTER